MEVELLEALESVANEPVNLKHHAAYIRLALQMQDGGEMAADARSQMVNAVPATDDVWIPMLRHKVATLDVNSTDSAETLKQLFAQAQNDYLSIPVLRLQIEALIDLNSREDLSEDVRGIWGDELTRESIRKLVRVGAAHISKSHEIWNLWQEWEIRKIEDLQNAGAIAKAIATIDAMFLERMRQIHIDYTATSDSYSTFVTAHFPPQQYERKLVQATKVRESALRMLSWKEHKITRGQLELKAQNGSIEDWKAYILWEKKSKKVQSRLVPILYERAIECSARERWAAIWAEDEARSAAAETALRGFWEDYLGFQIGEKQTPPYLINLVRRATRSVPGSGTMWSTYLRLLEAHEGEVIKDLESVPEAYECAISMNALQSNPDDFGLVVMARAAWRRRQCFGEVGGEVTFDEDGVADVLHVLQEGITATRKHPGGDPRMRLEGFLADFYLTFPPASMPDQALEVWQDATKFYSKSYLAWLTYVDLLIKGKQVSDARKVLKGLSQRKGIDWPEAIWERWISLEHLFGRNDDVQKCLAVIAVQRRIEEERRRKAWSTTGYSNAYQKAEETVVQTQTQESMEVDAVASAAGSGGVKRKREEEEVGVKDSPHKRVKIAEEPSYLQPVQATALTPGGVEAQVQPTEPLKRDRENATMIVTQLPAGITAEEINKIFKDCGAIREVQLKKVATGIVATVEFYSKESVLPALTKDKKRIQDEEISVGVAWRATLYVTNFREGMDDAHVREMFSKFGTILDVRWPSRRIKSTRRFCYIQYTSPVDAQAALSLNGTETEPGLAMNVYISDPGRKKERTDAGSKEIRVTGVAKSVKKADLESLFAKYGQVKEVRLVPAAGGNQTAFVDFTTEEDAQAALAVNNQLLKGRRLAVILADANVKKSVPGSHQDAAARSLRVKNLPEDTQEPLLQQVFEKLVPVKRVEIFVDSGEAVVELVNSADAGRLLLSSDAIEFGGKFLEISEEYIDTGRKGGPSGGPSKPKAGIGAQGRRGGIGFAVPRQVARKQAVEPVISAPIPAGAKVNATRAEPKSQDDFRKMIGR